MSIINNMHTNLLDRAINGVKWSTVSQFSRQGLRWITTVILARLLAPSDFGLISMAMVVIVFADLFKDFGTTKAVIQKKQLSSEFMSSVFWINVGLGLFLTALLFLLAPTVSAFYHEPKLAAILRLLSLSFFIASLSILHQTLLERNLAFEKLAKLEVISNLVGSVFGIGMAMMGYGVWSLVYQSLITVTLMTILLSVFNPWWPELTFRWSEIKPVMNYSLNYTGFRVLNYFERNADYILIGKFLGAQDLGFYTLAYRLMFYPIQAISHVIGRVMFPTYSQFQDDNSRFGRTFLQVAGAIALVTFPMMLGLMAVSELFVTTIFGAQWQPVIILVLILAPVGLVQSISTTAGEIFNAKGRADWLLRWSIFSGSLCILSFIIGLRWGLIGVAVAYGMVEIILTYPWFKLSFKLINLQISRLVDVLWQPLISSILMFVVLRAILMIMPEHHDSWLALGLILTFALIAYFAASWLVNRAQLRKMLLLFGVKI